MNKLGTLLPVWLLVGTISVGGCGAGENDSLSSTTGQPATSRTPPTSVATTTADRRPSFDPPRHFGADGIPVGPDNAVVGRETAYSIVSSDEFDAPAVLQAVGLSSGKVRWRQPLKAGGRRIGVAPPMPAIAVLAGGKETVSHAGIQTTSGAGTQQDRQQIVVGAFDGDSGASLWSAQSDLPAGFEPSRSDVLVVGATGRHVVASVSQSGQLPRALVVDVQARTAAWAEQGFLALGLDGTRVVGMKSESEWVSSGPVRALDVASLAPMWTSREKLASYEVKIAAPGVAQLKISQPFDSHTYLLDLATGARAADLPDRCECTFDQRSVLVCEGYDTLTALDINTKQQLWRLPDAASGRVKPKLHSAFHGLVYTKGQRGPVVLDARTGQDSVIDATTAPDVVVAGFGLVKEDKQLFAYAATG